MSANNFLLVHETKEPHKYSVYHGDADCGIDWDNDKPMGSFDSLEDAIRFADEYQSDNIVEYGIQMALQPKDAEI